MRLFEVSGPHDIPTTGRPRNYLIDEDAWRDELAELSEELPPSFARGTRRVGLYLLGRRSGRGRVHYFYIGKSNRNLIARAQMDHNFRHVANNMAGVTGTPVITFVVYSRQPYEHACPASVLAEMERFFIQQALMGGHVLANEQLTGLPDWVVLGFNVIRRYERAVDAHALKEQLGLGGMYVLDEGR